MTSGVDLRSVFDFSSHDEALTGLREVDFAQKYGAEPAPTAEEPVDPDDNHEPESIVVREVSDRMVCSACQTSFISREEQLEHYKLDWHRFNLRLKLSGLTPVTAEEFEKKSGAGDMSSISGSESDSNEEDSEDDQRELSNTVEDEESENRWSGRLSSKVFFLNSAGQYFSVHRCILHGKPDGQQDLVLSLKSIGKNTVWIVLMTGGGHFAGAVFQGKEVVEHKTFHRYTVRAKRGTAQGLKDSQNRSHAPKSAGAALRRYNEAALVKDIQDLLASWSTHLSQASAIFIRSPSYNKIMFFGGKTAPLDKKDPRIRSIPFATRRATFRELRRVHDVLSNVQVYGKDTDFAALCNVPKKEKRKILKMKITEEKDTEVNLVSSEEEEEEEGEIQLEMVETTLGTLDLRESEIYFGRTKKRRRKRKENQKDKENDFDMDEENKSAAPGVLPANKSQDEEPVNETGDESKEFGLRDSLFTACKVGDVGLLRGLLSQSEEENREQTGGDDAHPASLLTLLNKPVDSSGFTFLHVATAAAQKSVVQLLLETGADPTLRNNKGQTPFVVAPDKETRNIFRKYRGDNPDRYDYNKAQVPEPLTAGTESKKAEKKKAQKAQKKQREKEQKEEKMKQEAEAEEKKRFASLSDREKRALAAERRLAEQATSTGVSVSNFTRCWSCGESLLGKVPFKYLDFSFCTPRCVQAHRKSNAPAGKG